MHVERSGSLLEDLPQRTGRPAKSQTYQSCLNRISTLAASTSLCVTFSQVGSSILCVCQGVALKGVALWSHAKNIQTIRKGTGMR